MTRFGAHASTDPAALLSSGRALVQRAKRAAADAEQQVGKLQVAMADADKTLGQARRLLASM